MIVYVRMFGEVLELGTCDAPGCTGTFLPHAGDARERRYCRPACRQRVHDSQPHRRQDRHART